MECGYKLSKFDEEEEVESNPFKSLIESLHYLTHIRLDIIYAVRSVTH